jgi:hypothetical protein
VAKLAKVDSASALPPLHDRIGGQLLQAAHQTFGWASSSWTLMLFITVMGPVYHARAQRRLVRRCAD